jgi:hypothetical protein
MLVHFSNSKEQEDAFIEFELESNQDPSSI